MRKIVVIILIFIVTFATFTRAESRKLKWGLSAPVLSTTLSRELALSRNLNEKYMVLFWGSFYYDKNADITPNQEVFKNFSYLIETELRRNFPKKNKIIPYCGLALRFNYDYGENKFYDPYYYLLEFNTEIYESKYVGAAVSFGAEYFITSAISIFVHTRIFNIYYEWNHHDLDYNKYYDYLDEVKDYTSVKTKAFERSTLYVRFYF